MNERTRHTHNNTTKYVYVIAFLVNVTIVIKYKLNDISNIKIDSSFSEE